MSLGFVPITMGSPEFRDVDVDGFHITSARFAPHDYLPPHIHEHATVAMILDGSFDLCIAGKVLPCLSGTSFTEPPGEQHANRIESGGAHVLVIQPNLDRAEALGLDTRLVHDVLHIPRSPALRLAKHMVRELNAPDAATPIAVEGLALEMMALLTRLIHKRDDGSKTPPWLDRVEEHLRACYHQPLRVADVAREIGVHPVHLARVFRARHGITVGTFVRQLRLHWAAEQLETGSLPLATIAVRAGFSDQSHFSRSFKDFLGMTPQRYRLERRRR